MKICDNTRLKKKESQLNTSNALNYLQKIQRIS